MLPQQLDSLQQESALVCHICCVLDGSQNEHMSSTQGVVRLLYASWQSTQRHHSCTGHISGGIFREVTFRPGKTLNSAAGLPARVQIPVPPSATSRLLYELLVRVRLGFLMVSPFRIACVFLHVERGRSSKRVWRSPRIIYLFIYFNQFKIMSGIGLTRYSKSVV
jgi:hypothetical protein